MERVLTLDDAWDSCAQCGGIRGQHLRKDHEFREPGSTQTKPPRPLPSTLGEAVGIPSTKPDPMKVQVGGEHYTKLKIQPMQYSMANGLDALQHTVVKYVTRFRDKNGIEDLNKAKHAIDMLIAHEEQNGTAIR